MVNKRFWLILLMIVVSLMVIYIFWSTFQQAMDRRNIGSNINSKDARETDEFVGMKIKIPGAEKDGFWELKVKKFESLEEVGKLGNIEGDYFRNKKPIYRLTGETGTVYWNTKIFEVKGNVVLKTIDNRKRLTADEMIWDPSQGVTIQYQAVLQTENLLVTADAIHTNLDLNQVSFIGFTKVVSQSSVKSAN